MDLLSALLPSEPVLSPETYFVDEGKRPITSNLNEKRLTVSYCTGIIHKKRYRLPGKKEQFPIGFLDLSTTPSSLPTYFIPYSSYFLFCNHHGKLKRLNSVYFQS